MDDFPEGKYDGATCVGALTYGSIKVDDFLNAVCRIVRPGGIVVYTVNDLAATKLDPAKSLNSLSIHEQFMKDGRIQVLSMSLEKYYYNLWLNEPTNAYLYTTKILSKKHEN